MRNFGVKTPLPVIDLDLVRAKMAERAADRSIALPSDRLNRDGAWPGPKDNWPTWEYGQEFGAPRG